MNAIMLLAGFLIVSLFVVPCFMGPAVDNKKWGFVVAGLVLILVDIAALCQIVIGRTNEVTATETAKVMLNKNNLPMYDVVGSATQNNENATLPTYKVYLQSGKSKVVSPKIVHIKKSSTAHLKTEKKQIITHVFGFKIVGGKYADSTLYVNDKK